LTKNILWEVQVTYKTKTKLDRYEDAGVTVNYPKKTQMLTWHFVAPMVHDFAWAADKNYMHDIVQPNDVDLHFFKKRAKTIENWKKLDDDGQCNGFFQ
jgi:hypothetical protein